MMAMEDRSDTKIAVWCEHGDRVPEQPQGKTVAAFCNGCCGFSISSSESR
jgi:hypothetical protein